MVDFSVDAFKAKLVGGGARANQFRVIINFPAFAGGDNETTTFMTHKAVFPASKTNVVEVPFRGRKIPLSGDRTFEPVTVSILNDVDHPIRRAFIRWKNEIDNHSGNGGINPPSDYMSTVIIEQLDKNNEVTVTHKLIGAWPSEVNEIQTDWETKEEIESFDVQFHYIYWEEEGVTR